MIKKILLLTKSSKRKNNGEYGYCVAGIDFYTMEFIRLVADEKGDSLTDKEMQLKPLDIIQCNIDGPYPINNQVENYVIETNTTKKIDSKDIAFIKKLYEEDKFQRKSFFGDMSDRIANTELLGHSLSVIMVKDLIVYRDDKSKYRADFAVGNNKASNISMTDPDYYPTAKNATKNEPISIGNAIIIVSLPSDTPYCKFIAKIFEI